MAEAALSIKLRCSSWQQLATIYRRDLSRGAMFLKASTQPPIGTMVRIDLELPSATVIELIGVIAKHVVDPQRGAGVDLKLEPLPTKSVWLIESALAAENKVRDPAAAAAAGSATASGPQTALTDGQEVAEAEKELISALESEAESLRKLNPFLVLGVGYDTTDADVRAAFGELTKRYHPDKYARYQSQKLRQLAAEIFILIRDAYRKLADEPGRAMITASLGARVPARAQTQPKGSGSGSPSGPLPLVKGGMSVTGAMPKISVPPKTPPSEAAVMKTITDAPTSPSAKSAELANTELAKGDPLAIPAVPKARPTPPAGMKAVQIPAAPRPPTAPPASPPAGPQSTQSAPTVSAPPPPPPNPPSPPPAPISKASPSTPPPVAAASDNDANGPDALIDEGKLDEAIAAYRALSKKSPADKSARAGIELVEGMRALAARDRMEAAQRFEAALEIDPSNERAARELADMRRQATNERKGLLSRLMGKKEPT